MSTLTDLRPGDIMFAHRLRPRWVEGVVRAGQIILGETGYPQHVGVVTKRAGGFYPRIVQAMPRGAEEIEIGPEHFTSDYVYVRPNYYGNLHGGQAQLVADAARRYVGTPYSFLDYAAIAWHHHDVVWKIAPEACGSQRLAQYVRDSGHMICSQLVDQALTDAGWHTFSDGRLPQDVTPAALFRKLLLMPGQHRTGMEGQWTPNTEARWTA